MSESVLMAVQRDILYNDFVNSIISYCGLNCQPNDLVISYMHKSFENQRVLPFKISNQLRLGAYLSDATRSILRVYIIEKPTANENVEQDQQNLLNDEVNGMNMNIPDYEIGHDVEEDQTPTPIVDIGGSSPLKQLNNLQDDETCFYIGMTFKNKEELVTSLHIACLKKDFRLAKYHTCGSEHITSHNPHATAKVLGKFFKNSFPNGKGPSTRDMTNQLHTELGCKVSYWKIYKGREIAKSLVRGTHEHSYGVLDAYNYMLESANPGSKTTLQVDENGKFKYFFVAYAAWIQGFQQLRKVIVVDGTFLKSKYEGVLLSAVAQDADNHIFLVAFCVVDKECDASYQYFFEQMRSYVDDTDELCIIFDRHSSIRKMVSIMYPSAHYGCCMRHLGENIRNNFHNAKVVSHFYNAAKAYNKVEFYDHFNQIRDMVPKAAEHLESVGFHRWSRAFCPGNRYNIIY
ncbi:hypothetical protein KY290_017327 [Solanum tuberosum]|uniref:MULE transposase domain-containing protein n=1 Tax=Solanum tuberosum TaxID=4113 RepID=A0ABQ7VAZ6_SOLTU|nr:hypothetical protein KY290_017327 [Solanum tuberosum]